MKIINTKSLQSVSLLALLITLGGCTSVRNVHNDGVDLGFFKNKGEGNVGLSFDINDETAGVSGNVMFTPADNILIGAAISTYSYKIFNDGIAPSDPNYDVDEDNGQLKGYKFRGNIGYFDNFGRSGTGYLESMLTLAYGNNDLRLGGDGQPNEYLHYDYSPFSIGIQVGAGKNMEQVSLMGGLKFQRFLFDKHVPGYRSSFNDTYLVNGVSLIQIFYGMRFGGGPIKGNFQLGISFNPNDYDFVVLEPIPSLSFGVTYVFGRKAKTEVSF